MQYGAGNPYELLQQLARGVPAVFEEHFRCYSMAMAGRPDLEKGGKILLPQSALTRLTQMHVQYPMMFRLAVPGPGGRATHCGVQEFSSEEGRAYLPHWMMANLGLVEGAAVLLRNCTLPKARFVKIRPHSVDFLELKNPRAMLEGILRGYAALTVGDVICMHYAGTTYEFDVLEARPAVSCRSGRGDGGGGWTRTPATRAIIGRWRRLAQHSVGVAPCLGCAPWGSVWSAVRLSAQVLGAAVKFPVQAPTSARRTLRMAASKQPRPI